MANLYIVIAILVAVVAGLTVLVIIFAADYGADHSETIFAAGAVALPAGVTFLTMLLVAAALKWLAGVGDAVRDIARAVHK
ncbi:MAG: hypothetical protein ACFCVE_08825 [Phycisphaerae bacterium]